MIIAFCTHTCTSATGLRDITNKAIITRSNQQWQNHEHCILQVAHRYKSRCSFICDGIRQTRTKISYNSSSKDSTGDFSGIGANRSCLFGSFILNTEVLYHYPSWKPSQHSKGNNLLCMIQDRVSSTQETISAKSSDETTSLLESFPDCNQEWELFDLALAEGRRVFEPWKKLISPSFFGKQNVYEAIELASQNENKDRPILFVGNHTVFGILDLSVMFLELTQMIGKRRIRSLADPIHFNLFSEITGGKWGQFVSDLGGVQVSARNFYRLLSKGECILLFPGGAREVCRRRGEKHQLFWKSSTDFLRPASKHNAIIVPFSAVGADDSVNILIDGQELQKLPGIGQQVQSYLSQNRLDTNNLMPIASFPPKPDRYYFEFHKPLDLLSVDPRDDESCKALYGETKETVERGMHKLLKLREQDPQRYFETRVIQRVKEVTNPTNGPLSVMNSLIDSVFPGFDL